MEYAGFQKRFGQGEFPTIAAHGGRVQNDHEQGQLSSRG